MNNNIGRTLAVVDNIKEYFERNGATVDKEIRDIFVSKIPKAVVTNPVREIVEEQPSKVKTNDDKWEPLTKDSNAFVKLGKIHLKGESNTWGRSETVVDTSAEKVLAWLWDYCSNERMHETKNLKTNPREVRV